MATKGLIETWDVLKFKSLPSAYPWRQGLIETWDVLKFLIDGTEKLSEERLIETWDVLKFAKDEAGNTTTVINRNMRCIEMELIRRN